MKRGVLCLSLLSACSFLAPSEDPIVVEYALTWFCESPEGCERAAEAMRIDRMTRTDFFYLHFTSTQDAAFSTEAQIIESDTLGSDCSWLYYLSLFGHDMERQKLCRAPGGFEIELSIPNADPATFSKWVVSAQKVNLL
jgi:hypothetical protein